MKKKKIALIGNGKLTKCLVLGLIKSGTPMEEIIVIGRETSDLTFFESINVSTSRNIMDAKDIPNLILLVTPGGIGFQLKRLRKIEILKPFKNGWKLTTAQKIISISSGTNIEMFSKTLGIHHGCIVKGTMSTNVEHCEGLICIAGLEGIYGITGELILREIHELFAPVGEVSIVSSNEVTKAITTRGSMVAIDCRALELLHEGQKESLEEWLKKVNAWLEWLLKYEDAIPPLVKNEEFLDVAKYLQNKANVLCLKLGYSSREVTRLSIKTLRSTVAALIKSGCTSKSHFRDHIKKVVTEGGSTERGLGKMKNVNCLFSFEEFWDVIRPIYRKSKKFEKEANRSIKES